MSNGSINADWVRKAKQIGQRYSAFRANRSWHNLINLSTLGLALTLFAATIVASQAYIGSPGLRFLVQAIAFGHIYFVVHILVIHEASHNMFLIAGTSKNIQRINRICGWTACLYFGIHYDSFWKAGHAQHHKDPVANSDPQNCPQNTLSGKRLLAEIATLLIWPPHSFKSVLACPQTVLPKRRTTVLLWILQAMFFTVFFLAAWNVNAAETFFAAIYGFCIAQSLNLLKISMEHGGSAGKDPRVLYRSRSSEFFLRSLVMPLNISMHFEHHLNDTIPWYRLRRAHREIQQVIPPEVQASLFNNGLRATIRRIAG